MTTTEQPTLTDEPAVTSEVDAETVTGELVPLPDTLPELIEPLSETKAKALDKKIRAVNGKVSDNITNLFELLTEAQAGQIHVALGYASWPAYLADSVSVIPADKAQRKALVGMMSEEGVSNRAIAAIVGVDEKTVRRDAADDEGADNAAPKAKHGLDGKTYSPPKQPKAKKDKIIDAEVVPDSEVPEAKPAPVSKDFADEMGYLGTSVQSFKDILDDDRFAKAAKTITKRHLNTLQEYITELNKVVDVLMEVTT